MTVVFNRIGPYVILRSVGRGGHGEVYLAEDTRSGQRLALKLVRLGDGVDDREIVEAERAGADLQQQFGRASASVPTVFEFGETAGYLYVAMEYLDGENLSDLIARGALPVERAIAIATALCHFLEDAQRFEATVGTRQLRSLVHGDLKPRNVRITAAGDVKVLDFGIAKALSLTRKQTRNDFGTMAYLSPERLETGDVTQHADAWAVGVMLHEMVSGMQPFRAPDTRRLEHAIRSRRQPPAVGHISPPALQAVVAKLLGPTPADRYETAGDIRLDLDRAQRGEPTKAEEEGWLSRRVDEPPTQRTRPSDNATDEATRRTRPAAVDLPTTKPLRRDAVVPPPLPLPASPPALPAPAGGRWNRWLSNRRRVLRALLLVAAIGLVVNEMSVGREAARVEAILPTQDLADMGAVWQRYQEIEERSHLGFGTRSLERALTNRTMTLADRVIGNYRTPRPTVRERQWDEARVALAAAVEANPRNERMRGALRYCEGHLHRIDGEALKARKQPADAQRQFADAVVAFREAAELRPEWPDPFLGLARTFIIGLEDLERGADALEQARQRGFVTGDRENVQLADGYRTRGDALLRSATELDAMPQERDYVDRAVAAYRQALELYAKAGDLSSVARGVRDAQRGLERAEVWQTILALREPGTNQAPPLTVPLTMPAVPPEPLVP